MFELAQKNDEIIQNTFCHRTWNFLDNLDKLGHILANIGQLGDHPGCCTVSMYRVAQMYQACLKDAALSLMTWSNLSSQTFTQLEGKSKLNHFLHLCAGLLTYIVDIPRIYVGCSYVEICQIFVSQ